MDRGETALVEGRNAPVALPDWSRKTVYVLTVVVGGFTLGASGFELFSLARNAGFALGVALALPIGLDAGAAGAAVLWVVGPTGTSLRKQGKVTTLVLVAASALCNGISVLAVPMRTVVGEQEAAVVSAGFVTFVAFLLAFVFPIVAARAVHLLISVRDNASAAETPSVDDEEWDEFVELETFEDEFDAMLDAADSDSIAPEMAEIEPPRPQPEPDSFGVEPARVEPETEQLPVQPPVEDPLVAQLRALRAEHGWRAGAKERKDLGIAWDTYRNARDTLDKES